MAENLNINSITTPINVPEFARLLRESNYPKEDAEFLINGFTQGFDLGYKGPHERCDLSNNLPLSVGSPEEMWNKIMKEVDAGRFAGPFEKIPFRNYIQSPLGLVPKGETQTRLIFHLSYDFKNGKGPSIQTHLSTYAK